MPISRSACEITLTTSLSAASGARLKLMVAAGNCSWWAMTSGAVPCSKLATALNGTIELFPTVGMLVGEVEVNEVDCATA